MSEIILSDEQLEELAGKIVKKISDLMKHEEDNKIKQALIRAKIERLGPVGLS